MTTSNTPPTPRFLLEVVLKALLLFLLVNILFAALDPLPTLGRISAYNLLFPGRPRLPFGEAPDQAYNFSLSQIEALFASHEIAAGPKPEEEFRVLVLGDSSVWGFLLTPEQTLTGQLNAAHLFTADGREVRAYNLGHPTISLAKDLLILDYAMQYEPDLILWPITLEAFPQEKQTFSALVQDNPQRARALIETYDLNINPHHPDFVDPTFWERTLVGQRRPLADLLRLQVYGMLWAATGIDQLYPDSYTPRLEDLPDDVSYYGLASPFTLDDLAFDVLAAGASLAGEVPVLFINEPMFVSQGENSHLRYNFFYPRWAYDEYRILLAEFCALNHFPCLDLWDAVDNGQFTNSAIHLTPAGSTQLAAPVGEAILELANNPP